MTALERDSGAFKSSHFPFSCHKEGFPLYNQRFLVEWFIANLSQVPTVVPHLLLPMLHHYYGTNCHYVSKMLILFVFLNPDSIRFYLRSNLDSSQNLFILYVLFYLLILTCAFLLFNIHLLTYHQEY